MLKVMTLEPDCLDLNSSFTCPFLNIVMAKISQPRHRLSAPHFLLRKVRMLVVPISWLLTHVNTHISQFSRLVVSNSLLPHVSQHTRPPCPSPTPGVHSDSRPSSQWCHPAISSSVIPFSSCPQSLPASVDSLPKSQLFA